MRNTCGLGKVTVRGILLLFILLFLAISSLSFAAVDLNRNIAALEKEIEVAQSKLAKAKPGDDFDRITVTMSMKNMQKLVTSLSQQVRDVPSMAAHVNKLNDAMKSLEGARKRNDKSGAQKILKDMAATLRALETEVARRGKVKTAPRVAAPGTPSSKIENFLKDIEKARSLDDVGKAYKRSKFSEQELKKLEKEIRTPPYSSKLQNLIKQSATSAKVPLESSGQRITKEKQQALRRKQQQELRSLNQQAQVKLQSLRVRVTPRAKRLSSLELTAPPAQGVRPGADREGLARIRRFEPAQAVVGQNLTIYGENFGTRRTVSLTVEGMTVSVPIVSWQQGRIVVTIPSGLEPNVGETEKDGRIWIYAEENIATGPIPIVPDTSRMTPEIISLSSGEIRPGQILVIEGSNFLTERRGTVEFRFSGMTLDGIIDSWEDSIIQVRLREDLSGLLPGDGSLEVANHLGVRTNRRMTFIPNMESVVLTNRIFAGCLIECLCFCGERNGEYVNNFDLINGWTVASERLDVAYPIGINSGCRYLNRAEIGSTDARARIEAWADAFSLMECQHYLEIQGPAGTRYR